MKKKIFLLIALVLCMALMVGVLAACNEGGTTGTGGDNTQGGVTPGGDDEQGGNTPGGDDEQGGNTPGGDDENQGGNTPGGNPGGWDPDDFPWGSGDDDDDDDTPGGDFPWNPGGDDDDDTPGGDFPWNPGSDDDGPVVSDGDVIFTEDASLAEILAALENAENFTCEMSEICTTVSDGAIVSEINNIVQVSENAMYSITETKSDGTIGRYDYAIFTEGGVAFSIGTSGTEVDEREKDLLSNIDPLALAEPHIDPLYNLLTEENGKIVLNPEVTTYYTDLYLRLEGDRLVIGYTDVYDNENGTIELVYSKVNATGVIVPEELRELAYEAEWSDSVSYNGVDYRKSDDGTYYYVSYNYTGVEPESYINTLPVREEGEDPDSPQEPTGPFVDGMSLQDIENALTEAGNFTFWYAYSYTDEDGTYHYSEAELQCWDGGWIARVVDNYPEGVAVSENFQFAKGGIYFDVEFSNLDLENGEFVYTENGELVCRHNRKNLLKNSYFDASEVFDPRNLFLTEDELGDVVFDGYAGSVADPDIAVRSYIMFEGDELRFGEEYTDANGAQIQLLEHRIYALGQTDTTLPGYVEDILPEAEWDNFVDYNGVSYRKEEDEYGEYYRVYSVEEGAMPEETINTLPVRERGEDPDSPQEPTGPFVDGMSLQDIVNALTEAGNYTAWYADSSTDEDGTYSYSEAENRYSDGRVIARIVDNYPDRVAVSEHFQFVKDGVYFDIGFANSYWENGEFIYTENGELVCRYSRKNLLKNSYFFATEDIDISNSYLIEDEFGNVVFDGYAGSVADPDITVRSYIMFEGDELRFGAECTDANGIQISALDFRIYALGQTDTTLPGYVEDILPEVEWDDLVDYNGVSYHKAEDEYGEYYYVYSVQEGAVPEETINTLPVREEGEAPAVPEGDVIFTEDASLAEILAALENAESFTCEANSINSTVSDGAIVSEINNIIQVSENAMYIKSTTKSDGTIGVYECAAFTEEGVFYIIADDGTEMSKEKNLVSNSDPVADEYIFLLSDFLTEENGKIVLNPEVAEGEYDIYLRLEGDRLVIGLSRIYNNEKETVEYVWSKVNATDVVIPEEVKALAADAEWDNYVSYNGVGYQKAEDATGEYYYVSSVQEGAVPEETINTLPVRER